MLAHGLESVFATYFPKNFRFPSRLFQAEGLSPLLAVLSSSVVTQLGSDNIHATTSNRTNFTTCRCYCLLDLVVRQILRTFLNPWRFGKFG